jgi:hypothetical protein
LPLSLWSNIVRNVPQWFWRINIVGTVSLDGNPVIGNNFFPDSNMRISEGGYKHGSGSQQFSHPGSVWVRERGFGMGQYIDQHNSAAAPEWRQVHLAELFFL